MREGRGGEGSGKPNYVPKGEVEDCKRPEAVAGFTGRVIGYASTNLSDGTKN